MDRRFLTSMLTSAMLAAAAAGLFYRFASVSARPPETTPVVYASTALPVGARIRRSDVKLVSIPVSIKPKDSFARLEEVIDRPVIAAIIQDEPVLKERLADPGSGAGLAPMIPAGFRALAVRVNDVIGVAGYVEPGMKVDVLVTGRPPQSDETFTRTVLQNITVLSAGHVLQPEPKGEAINATVVTLQVTPREAEMLTLATEGGHIQLVLRNSTDSVAQTTPGAQLSAMYGVGKPRVVEAARPAPPRPVEQNRKAEPQPVPAVTRASVEVIRGNRRTVEIVDPGPMLTEAAK